MDNVVVNPGFGGAVVRAVAKNITSASTQVMILDVGGGTDASPETPLTLGPALSAASLPVVIASDQGPQNVAQSGAWTAGRTWTLSAGSDVVSSVQNGTWTVGLSGLLPAFAATPTVNLGTLGGAGTAANQATEIAYLTTIASNSSAVHSAPGASAATALTVQGSAAGVALPVADSNSAAFAGAVAMTVGTLYAPQRAVGVLATNAGNVQFLFPDASTLTLPVIIGWQTFPFACTQIVASGTNAPATFFNLK